MRIKRLNLLQSEKGGSGKTTVTDGIVAGLYAASARVLVVDADDGNSGYIRRAGKQGVLPLPWSADTSTLTAWLENIAVDIDTIVIDCGANIMASGAPVNEFLGELAIRVVDAGGIVIPLAIASTNAPGTDRLVRHLRDAYGDVAKVRLIQNNQDGSGNFARTLTTLGLPTATYPHIPSGIQAARLLTAAPLLNVLQRPPEAYAIAMACYAEKVVEFIAQPAITDLFGDNAVSELRSLAAKAPGRLGYTLPGLKDATDQALTANRALTMASERLASAIGTNRADLRAVGEAALSVSDAMEVFQSSRR